MTFEKIREILLDMKLFRMRGSMSPPNNRVIFEHKPLKIIVTPTESQIMVDNYLQWSFTLKGLSLKELFVMLDDYFPQPDEEYEYTWVHIEMGNAQDWINFKTKWLRQEKLEELI